MCMSVSLRSPIEHYLIQRSEMALENSIGINFACDYCPGTSEMRLKSEYSPSESKAIHYTSLCRVQ
jgi:hypothetical protein